MIPFRDGAEHVAAREARLVPVGTSPPADRVRPEKEGRVGSREFLPEDLWPGYDALVELLQGVRPDDPVKVICFVDPYGGVRVSEISWKTDPDKPGKNVWIRMNPWDAGVILGAEKFILSHGVEPNGDVDFHGQDRDRLLEMFE